MRKLRGTAIAAVLTSISLIAAGSATAATEVGSNCTANTAGGNETFVTLTAATGSTLPIAAPSAGVLAEWKLSVASFAGSTPQALKVLRPTGVDKEFEVIAESPQSIVGGNNSFKVKIPVQAGDRFGLYGSGTGAEIKTLACLPAPGAALGIVKNAAPVGSKQLFATEIKEAQVPVLAVIEPDADKDGYGDETQDKCPTAATIQAVACPPLLLDAVAGAVGKSSATILVATSIDAPISVTGTVKLPGGSKKARVSAQATLKATGQTVTPGKIAAFKLKFSASLKSALKATPKSKKLTLKVKAEGTNVAGVVSTDSLTVKLKGQG